MCDIINSQQLLYGKLLYGIMTFSFSCMNYDLGDGLQKALGKAKINMVIRIDVTPTPTNHY